MVITKHSLQFCTSSYHFHNNYTKLTVDTWNTEEFTDDKKINKFLRQWHQWSADYRSNDEYKTAVAPTAECEQTVRQAGQMTFTIQQPTLAIDTFWQRLFFVHFVTPIASNC